MLQTFKSDEGGPLVSFTEAQFDELKRRWREAGRSACCAHLLAGFGLGLSVMALIAALYYVGA